jgi:putative colanic acid biosynthesis UDP-glucose lipid carrier transferase
VPLMALLIKLTSKGPVFFVQERSGKNNQYFYCLKFRTLDVNAEANTKQVTKDDKRITKLGRFLRKTNLDELPQFVNVLLGDMSVVGPRPHMLKHTSMFSELMAEYMIRHFVKPGVTGWAQVNGSRGEIKKHEDLRKRIEHDIWYMENWSIWLDLKIIWLTIFTTIKGDSNAY